MRRNPDASLLDRCLALYLFRAGLSCDENAALLGVNRRTILKWEASDNWKNRSVDFEENLELENLEAWMRACLKPTRAAITTNHFPPDPPEWSYPNHQADWQRFQGKKSWPALAQAMHPKRFPPRV